MSQPVAWWKLVGRVARESRAVRATVQFAVVTLAVLGILSTRLSAVNHRTITLSPRSDEASIPSAAAIRILSLGHREWAADVLWVIACEYFGDTLVTHQQQRYLQRYADTIEDVDPRFQEAYRWAATISIYNASRIRRDSVENAIRHLERGLREFPDDGDMLDQLGFDYNNELVPLLDNDEEKAEMRRRGAEYLRRAAALGYGPPWMALSAASALEGAGLVDQAIQHLEDLYLRTDDPAARERIETRLETLVEERHQADPALEEIRRLDAERLRYYPYMSPMLYLFVGPPVDHARPVATDVGH